MRSSNYIFHVINVYDCNYFLHTFHFLHTFCRKKWLHNLQVFILEVFCVNPNIFECCKQSWIFMETTSFLFFKAFLAWKTTMTNDTQHDRVHDYKVGVQNSAAGWLRIVHYASSWVIILKMRSKVASVVHIKYVTKILHVINYFLRLIS